MQIERVNDEIVIRISEKINPDIIQNILNYVKANTIISKSNATEEEIENISNEIKSDWWTKNKTKFLK